MLAKTISRGIIELMPENRIDRFSGEVEGTKYARNMVWSGLGIVAAVGALAIGVGNSDRFIEHPEHKKTQGATSHCQGDDLHVERRYVASSPFCDDFKPLFSAKVPSFPILSTLTSLNYERLALCVLPSGRND